MLLKRIIEEVMLYEGLEMTHAIDTSLNNLMRMWNFENKITYEERNETIRMDIQQPIDKEEFDLVINHIENVLGYFPSHLSTSTSNFRYDYKKAIEFLGSHFAIYFDAKYDQEISERKMPKFLYHLSNSENESKILKSGLIPKRKSKLSSHPDRIYLTITPESAMGLVKNKAFLNKHKEFVLFEIDYKELKRARKIRFFSDPAFLGKGLYTYENIPPEYLKVIKRIS